MSATFKLSGQRELVDKLKSMDRKIKRSIATKTVRAGARVTAAAIKAAAPVDTGAGRRAIGTKVKTYKNGGATVAIVGERKGKRRSKKLPKAAYGAPHFHLIEQGTIERFHTGEKAARAFAAVTTARYRAGRFDSAKYVRASLASTGSFGRSNVAGWSTGKNKRLEFSRNLRDVQQRLSKGQTLRGIHKAIAADYGKGKRTGRITAKPFFQKAWRGAIAATQAAQLVVLRREIEAAARGAA